MNRQEALTSKQIMLILSSVWLLWATLVMTACDMNPRVATVISPYERRQVFAVAPLRNESGNSYADGLTLADKLAQQLALTRGIDVLPVNRTLSAMHALGIAQVTEPSHARQLQRALGVDGFVVGTITAYDPYFPPKLGLAVELYVDGQLAAADPAVNPRELTRSPTNPNAILPPAPSPGNGSASGNGPGTGGPWSRSASGGSSSGAGAGPASAIAGFYDAADPVVIDLLDAYANRRGPDGTSEMTRRRYRISIDLYSEFVSYQLTERLMRAEQLRLGRPTPTDTRQAQASLTD